MRPPRAPSNPPPLPKGRPPPLSLVCGCCAYPFPPKDRDWELELSWICDETKKVHQWVPRQLQQDAAAAAQAAAQDFDD